MASLSRRLQQAARSAAGFRGGDGQGPPLAVWVLAGLAAWALAWLYAPVEPALQLVPPFLLLGALWPVLRLGQERLAAARRGRLVELLIATLVMAAVLLDLYGPFVIDKRLPIDSCDHQMWRLRAQLFAEALSSGRWDRWTFLWQGGDTLTDQYPYLFDLTVGIASLVLPFSLKSIYTGAVLLALLGRGLAVFALCRRFGGSVVSLVVAVAVMSDGGINIVDGGVHATVIWGLIHSHCALSFGIAAVAQSTDLVDGTDGRKIALCALATGAAVFTHPVGMLFMTVWTVALALALLFRKVDLRRAGWAVGAVATGLLLAAWHAVPAVRALAEHGFSAALPGPDYYSLSPVLLKGVEPGSGYPMMVGLGMVAVIAAATSRRPALVAAGIACLLFYSYLLQPLAVQTRVFDYARSLLLGQSQRMEQVVKLMAAPAMAWVLSRLFDPGPAGVRADGASRADELSGSLRPRAVLFRTLALALLLLGPVRLLLVGTNAMTDFPVGLAFTDPQFTPERRPAADEKAVFDFIAAQRKADPSPALWRVGMMIRGRYRHTIWPEAARTGVPIVDFRWVVGNFLAYRPREWSPAGVREWTIRYLLTASAGVPMAGAKLRLHNGGLWLWDVPEYDGKSVVVAGPQLKDVKIDGLRFGPDEIRFTVSGAPPEGVDLRVRSAWYPRWRARVNGQKVPVVATLPHPGAIPRQEQIGLHAGNGEVVLRCDGPMPGGYQGFLLSLLAVGFLSFSLREDRRAWLEAKLSRARQGLGQRLAPAAVRARALVGGRGRVLLLALVVVVILGGVLARVRGSTMLRRSPWEGGGVDVWLVKDGRRQRCRSKIWLAKLQCDDQTKLDFYIAPNAVVGNAEEYPTYWPGLRLTARAVGTVVEIEWPGTRLRGQELALRTHGQGSFKVQSFADGLPLGEKVWAGPGEQLLVIPPTAGRIGKLTMRFESQRPNGIATFDGRLRAASSPAKAVPPPTASR
jgi:hypothetical protein